MRPLSGNRWRWSFEKGTCAIPNDAPSKGNKQRDDQKGLSRGGKMIVIDFTPVFRIP